MVISVANAVSAYRQAGATDMVKGLTSTQEVGGSFSDTLKDFMGDAIEGVRNGEKMATLGAKGQADLQEVILAVSNAELMMQTITSIRDKVISAYQEVLRTAI